MENLVKLQYRVWHMPQVGSDAGTFYVDVASVKEGVTVMNALANYDLFQFENNVKPDYSNAQGIQQCGEGEQINDSNWEDFEAEIDGEYFDDPEMYLDYIKDSKGQ